MPLSHMQLSDDEPTIGQLRARVRHLRNHLNRTLDAIADGQDQSRAARAIRRAQMLETQAALELAIAELQGHPDWRG